MTNSKTEMRHPASRAFLAACDHLAEAFCGQLGVSGGGDDAWWITPGEVFAFQAGEMFADAEEMMLALEHGMDYDQWSEWYWQWNDFYDDSDFGGERKPGCINLRSWQMGARPGQPPEEDPQEAAERAERVRRAADALAEAMGCTPQELMKYYDAVLTNKSLRQ